ARGRPGCRHSASQDALMAHPGYATLHADKVGDRLAQELRLVVADRVAAVFEDMQLRAFDDAMNLLGKFRRADPVVADAKHERRRRDGGKLRTQIAAAQKSAALNGSLASLRPKTPP